MTVGCDVSDCSGVVFVVVVVVVVVVIEECDTWAFGDTVRVCSEAEHPDILPIHHPNPNSNPNYTTIITNRIGLGLE